MVMPPNAGDWFKNTTAEFLSSLQKEKLEILLKNVPEADSLNNLYNWRHWARDTQLPPKGNWTTWLMLGGRGAGKTRTGAEWITSLVCGQTINAPGAVNSVALVGETYGDVREVMIEGPSGLRNVSPPSLRPSYEASRHRLVWPNGAVASCFSAEDPEGLRGFQFEAAWSDELCKWRYDEATWSNLQLGLRLGQRPRQMVTTTPRPKALLKRIMNTKTTVTVRSSTYDNKAHLARVFIDEIAALYEGTTLGRQELLGEIVEDQLGALWRWSMIEASRIEAAPDLGRIVIAVDPPVTSGEAADECGLIVAGVTGAVTEQVAYVLADHSTQGLSPVAWGKEVVAAYHRYQADRIVIEINQGGELVENILRQIDPSVPVMPVRASRSKRVRAEPVAALYERGLVRHVGSFPELEDQLTSYTGSSGSSPDRLDALVWAVTALMLGSTQSPTVRFL